MMFPLKIGIIDDKVDERILHKIFPSIYLPFSTVTIDSNHAVVKHQMCVATWLFPNFCL